MANGKTESRRDAETGILKSEPETKKCGDLIEKHICDRQTQNLRLRDPLVGSAVFRDLDRICRDSHFSKDHPPPLHLNQKRDKKLKISLTGALITILNRFISMSVNIISF